MVCPNNFLFYFTAGEPQCECTGVNKSEDETAKEDTDDKEADSNKEPEEVEREEEDTDDKEPTTVEKEEEEEPYTCECNAYNFGKLTLAREDDAGGIVVTNADGKKANLLVENILASNGVIHLIDRVLF